jgi:hypothetical protein
MKTPTRPPQVRSGLSGPLQHRLNMYALAASAAGVSALALAQPAAARVIYTSTSVALWPGGTYRLDLNHDGRTDFSILNRSCVPHSSSSCLSYVGETAKLGNFVAGSQGHPPFALAFQLGSMIGGSGEAFYPGKAMLAGIANPGTYCSGGVFGPWREVSNQYLGLKFQIKHQTHYGWARLTVDFSGRHFQTCLTGYAYETIPNKPIVAGRTKGADVITVKPATLGSLALGRR